MSLDAIELPSGEVFTISDWGDYPIWSRGQMDNAQAQDVILFNYNEAQPVPGGGGGPAATKIDTNLEQASALPLDNQMVIFSCQIKYDEIDGATSALTAEPSGDLGLAKWNIVQSNTLFSFTVNNTHPFIQGTVDQFPCGGGLFYQESVAASARVTEAYAIQNGFPTGEAARALALPVHIGPLQTFKGTLSWDRGALPAASTTNFGMTVIMYGPRQRPVG